MSANMNNANNELTHDKIQAEIAQIFVNIEKMRAETAKVNNEIKDSDVLTAKLMAETAKVNNEIKDSDVLTAKLMAETAKINKENQWYPAIAASTATLAIVAIVKLFL